ncbi:hypothetical protein [Secundilactobacillus muriivasis]
MTREICPNCGYELKEALPYCPQCGEPLETETTQSRQTRSQAQATSSETTSRTQRQRSVGADWRRGLVPSREHLQQVREFFEQNVWGLLVAYGLSLVFNGLRWWIFAIYLILCYGFPLLTGRTKWWGKQTTQQDRPHTWEAESIRSQFTERPEADVELEQPHFTDHEEQPQATTKQAHRPKLNLMSNGEFRIGSILVIPSLIIYLIGRHGFVTSSQASSIFETTNLGLNGYFYVLGLGALGIGVACVLGGLVKGLTHHRRGGQKLKRWAVLVALFTMLMSVAMLQNASATVTSVTSIVTTIGTFLIQWLPWGAMILYALGIGQNLITRQQA